MRSVVGCLARIVEHEELPDGRWAAIAVGTERIVVELKDKVLPAGSMIAAPAGTTAPPSSPGAYQDALTALLTLGYKATDADKAVRQAADALGAEVSTEELIRKALGR